MILAGGVGRPAGRAARAVCALRASGAADVLVVALALEVGLRLVPPASSWPVGALLLAGGVALHAVGTALHVGVRLGPGPRDGLMTGLVARTGRPVAFVRGGIEGSVVLVG